MSVQAPPMTSHPTPPRRSWTTVVVVATTCLVVAGVALALVVGLVSGASSRAAAGAREPMVSGTTLASGITAQTHGRARNVSCPNVPARAGASTVCTATVDGAPARIRTTITSSTGSRVQFDFAQIS